MLRPREEPKIDIILHNTAYSKFIRISYSVDTELHVREVSKTSFSDKSPRDSLDIAQSSKRVNILLYCVL